MGRKMKIVIVGLPLFAERLAAKLTEYDRNNQYICLDTYYKKWDKIKARVIIPRADVVFSINGSLTRSGVFDLALSKNIPLVMNWVGTDVLKAIDAVKNGKAVSEYKTKAIHYCEVDWIKEELAETGIVPEIVNFASFDQEFALKVPQNDLTVLTYISDGRAEFYGIKSILKLADRFPSVNFLIAGTKAEKYEPLPKNVKALGWVNNMGELFDQSHVCIRFPEHDGLSTFILEALARGKEVLYKYPFTHCHHCPDESALEDTMSKLKEKFENGQWEINTNGADLIRNEFSSNAILGGLINRFRTISGKK